MPWRDAVEDTRCIPIVGCQHPASFDGDGVAGRFSVSSSIMMPREGSGSRAVSRPTSSHSSSVRSTTWTRPFPTRSPNERRRVARVSATALASLSSRDRGQSKPTPPTRTAGPLSSWASATPLARFVGEVDVETRASRGALVPRPQVTAEVRQVGQPAGAQRTGREPCPRPVGRRGRV